MKQEKSLTGSWSAYVVIGVGFDHGLRSSATCDVEENERSVQLASSNILRSNI